MFATPSAIVRFDNASLVHPGGARVLDGLTLDIERGEVLAYDAVPVVRTASLLQHPELKRAVARLAGRISEQDMRAMNRAVDGDRQDPRSVARRFLEGL